MNESVTLLENIKCLNCDVAPCLQLFSRNDNGSGGELYILKTNLEGESKFFFCANSMILKSLCLILTSYYKEEDEESLRGKVDNLCHMVGTECIRDLKASILLAFSGHHKPSMQIMRSCLENWLYALYYQKRLILAWTEEDQETYSKVIDEFEQWANKSSYKTHSLGPKEIRKLLMRLSVINPDKDRFLSKLYNNLSVHVHSIKYTPMGQYICNGDSSELTKCGAILPRNEKNLEQWCFRFQDIMTFIIRSYLEMFPDLEQDEGVKELLSNMTIPLDMNDETEHRYIIGRNTLRFIRKDCRFFNEENE